MQVLRCQKMKKESGLILSGDRNIMKEPILRTKERDPYGNIVKFFSNIQDWQEIKTFKYNPYFDLIEEETICIREDSKTESLLLSHYEYDSSGNKSKLLQSFYYQGILQSQTTYYYNNEYDAYNKLVKATRYGSDMVPDSIITFEWQGTLLMLKKYFKSPLMTPYKISYYSYKDSLLEEKKCCLGNGEVSYFIKYTMLENGLYKKDLISPARGIYHWLIDDIAASLKWCSCFIKESPLTPDLLKEICDFILNTYSFVRNLRIDICESEDITYHYEIKQMEQYYLQMFDLRIIRDI